MVNWELIPHSKASNSYELLEDVIKAILDEPRRIFMNHWNVVQVGDLNSMLGALDSSSGAGWIDKITRFPSCGTIGCISGWMNILSANRLVDVKAGRDGAENSYGKLMPKGLREALVNLFHGSVSYPFPLAEHGTLEYASAVVDNIRKFMDRYDQELKGHRLHLG